MNSLEIQIVSSQYDSELLDEILWEILWKPVELPRSVRESFKLDGKTIEIMAKERKTVLGGLVANWISKKKIEIRHIAVLSTVRRKNIGKCLIEKLKETLSNEGQITISTISRNSSIDFFSKLGFKAASNGKIEHPSFLKFGIAFQKIEIKVNSL